MKVTFIICYIVRFGVESGDDYIRNEVLNRGLARKQIINAFSLCGQKGILTRADIMIGVSFENFHSILGTTKLSAQIRPNIILQTIFYPGIKLDDVS